MPMYTHTHLSVPRPSTFGLRIMSLVSAALGLALAFLIGTACLLYVLPLVHHNSDIEHTAAPIPATSMK